MKETTRERQRIIMGDRERDVHEKEMKEMKREARKRIEEALWHTHTSTAALTDDHFADE